MHFSIKIYMVCRYSFELFLENSIFNIYPKLLPHMSSYLKAIEKNWFFFVFLFNLMHFSIKIYILCSFSFELFLENSIFNIYLKLLLHMSSYLKAIDLFLFNLMHFSIRIYMVCSYSFELSQKTIPTTFILNYNLICLLILKL